MKSNPFLFVLQVVLTLLLFLYASRSPLPNEHMVTGLSNAAAKSSVLPVDREISGVIRYGETLWDILRSYGVPEQEIPAVVDTFKRIFEPRDFHAGARYRMVQDTGRQLLRYEYQPDPVTTYCVIRDSSGHFSADIKRKQLEKRIRSVCGSIQSTLYESLIEKGQTPELILQFTDIFQWDVDFFVEPQIGDSYKIVYEAYYLDDSFIRYGNILAAQFVRGNKVMNAFYYKPQNGKGGYYEWNGQSVQKKFLKSPLNYRRISSYFSLGRLHPILKRVRPHYGVDFAAAAGTPVVAPADGVVIEIGYQRGGIGRYLKIRHSGTHFTTLYGHLKSFAKGIRKGVRVSQRQVIGFVGATGLATGPHLHYTFYENGRPINPLRIRNASADPLPPQEVEAFHQAVLPYLTKLAEMNSSFPAFCAGLL